MGVVLHLADLVLPKPFSFLLSKNIHACRSVDKLVNIAIQRHSQKELEGSDELDFQNWSLKYINLCSKYTSPYVEYT